MKDIQDLINTPERLRIFKAVTEQDTTFTSTDVQFHLQKDGTNIRITTIQNLLRGLCYRGYLEQFSIKTTTTRGRSTIHFKKAQNVVHE
jgi:Fe2+ or Zn2+ uptake regulation protein